MRSAARRRRRYLARLLRSDFGGREDFRRDVYLEGLRPSPKRRQTVTFKSPRAILNAVPGSIGTPIKGSVQVRLAGGGSPVPGTKRRGEIRSKGPKVE